MPDLGIWPSGSWWREPWGEEIESGKKPISMGAAPIGDFCPSAREQYMILGEVRYPTETPKEREPDPPPGPDGFVDW